MKHYLAVIVAFSFPVAGPCATAAPRHSAPSPVAQQQRASPVAEIPVEAPPRLYDFKGVQLESTVEQFRALKHPDGKAGYTACTGDKDSKTDYDTSVFDVEKKLGVIKCAWFDKTGSSLPLNLATSGYFTSYYSFLFIRDPIDGAMRLYRIEAPTNSDAMPNVVAALTEKFGKPQIEISSVKNGLGNSFDQTTAYWDNRLSKLVVRDRVGRIDRMDIVLIDKRLNDIVLKEKAAEAAAVPNAI
jgi:hypothetical protein